jgi:hypothetical protein
MGTNQFAFARTLPRKWASSDSLARVPAFPSDGGNLERTLDPNEGAGSCWEDQSEVTFSVVR